LVEAAKLAPRWYPELALLYEREKQKGNRNRATLAVARKLAAYLAAVDRGERIFHHTAPPREPSGASQAA
jgi:transposase